MSDIWACRDFVNRSWLPWHRKKAPTDWLLFADLYDMSEQHRDRIFPVWPLRPRLLARYKSLDELKKHNPDYVLSFITDSQVELKSKAEIELGSSVG
jgi:hypothetical protein